MRSILSGLILAVAIPTAAGAAPDAQRIAWNRPIAPFRIFGDVYYVGTAGLSAFLITGPKGHVLVDGALPESAGLIAGNIRTLGFRPTDIRYLLINHAHYDHAGGLAALKQLTGATLVAGAGDAADLRAGRTRGRPGFPAFAPVTPDRLVRNGDVVRLGPIRLTAIATPGHTAGSTSWAMTDKGRRILFASSLTVAGQRLIADPYYPTAAADFRAAFARLRTERADIFLTFHPEFFDMQAKRVRQRAGDANAFVDRQELGRVLDRAEQGFATDLAAQTGAVSGPDRAAVPR